MPPPPPPVATVPAPVVLPPPVVPPPVPAPEPPPAPNNAPIVMGVGFGVGAVGVLVGGDHRGRQPRQHDTIRGQCTNNQCKADQQGPIDSANTLANVSNVSFALGAAGVVVGVIGVFMRPSPKAPKTGVRLTPILGPGAVGLGGSF